MIGGYPFELGPRHEPEPSIRALGHGRIEGGLAPDQDRNAICAIPQLRRHPVARISGRAEALDAWLWGRLPGSAVEQSGDPDALAAFGAVIAPGIE